MLSPALVVAAIFAVTAPPSGRSAHAHLASVDSRVAPKKLVKELDAKLGTDAIPSSVAIFSPAAPPNTSPQATPSAKRARSSRSWLRCRRGIGSRACAVSGSRAALELGVLDAAARSASAAIPEAVRRSRKQR